MKALPVIWQAVIGGVLGFVTSAFVLSGLAMAASVDAGGLVNAVIYLIILGIVVGILLFLVRRAPFIPAEAKTIIVYVIYFVCAIFIINWLLGFTSNGPFLRF